MATPFIKTGTYAATGSALSVTGLGFQPELVIVKDTAALTDTYFCTKDMPATNSLPIRADGAHVTDAIVSLDADGFSIGTSTNVNTSGHTIAYLAIKDNGANVMQTITYTGDGTDGKSLTLPWVPDYVLLKADSAITGASSFPGAGQGTAGSSFVAANAVGSVVYDGGGSRNDLIQVHTGIGLFLGNGSSSGGNLINVSAAAHYGFGFKITSGLVDVVNYTGNGTNNTTVTVGFQPTFLHLAGDSGGVSPETVYGSETAGNAQPFDSSATTGIVNSLTGTGFTLGTGQANTTGVNYWGLALASSIGSVATSAKVFKRGFFGFL